MEIVQTKELPALIKKSSIYKMHVPANVEEKIRYLLRKYPSTEWSGVLFYTFTGTFEDENLEITCKDIYPMDLGNATFTSYIMDANVAGYISDNPDLFECDLGLIHSHHNMATFFSGTDTNTLREEGNERNCFVSLIVNNAGTYSAAVTRKIVEETEIMYRTLGRSYEFFGNGPVNQEEKEPEETGRVEKEEYIEYFMLDVDREQVNNPLQYLDERFEEISKLKSQRRIQSPITETTIPDSDYGWGTFFDYYNKPTAKKETKKEVKKETNKDKEEKLPDVFSASMYADAYDYDFPPLQITPDKREVHTAVVRIVTCSLSVNTEGFDLGNWINKHLNTKYKKIFGDPEKDSYFDSWCDFAIEFYIYKIRDAMDTNMTTYESEECVRSIAKAMFDELAEYADTNTYIATYCQTLEVFITQ